MLMNTPKISRRKKAIITFALVAFLVPSTTFAYGGGSFPAFPGFPSFPKQEERFDDFGERYNHFRDQLQKRFRTFRDFFVR